MLSKQMGIPWDDYQKRTIKDAVAELPESIANPIIRAFKATNAMDVYGGVLEQYLAVIAQRLEDQTKKTEELGGLIAQITDVTDGISRKIKVLRG